MCLACWVAINTRFPHVAMRVGAGVVKGSAGGRKEGGVNGERGGKRGERKEKRGGEREKKGERGERRKKEGRKKEERKKKGERKKERGKKKGEKEKRKVSISQQCAAHSSLGVRDEVRMQGDGLDDVLRGELLDDRARERPGDLRRVVSNR